MEKLEKRGNEFREALVQLNACSSARKWVNDNQIASMQEAILKCERFCWLIWLYNKTQPDDDVTTRSYCITLAHLCHYLINNNTRAYKYRISPYQKGAIMIILKGGGSTLEMIELKITENVLSDILADILGASVVFTDNKECADICRQHLVWRVMI